MNSSQIENLKKELEKIGIRTDTELQEAISALPPVPIYIMTGNIKTGKRGLNHEEQQ